MHTLRCSDGRIGNVLSLKRSLVQDGRLAEAYITGKGGKQRMLFLDPPALLAISHYCHVRRDTFEALLIAHRRGLGQALTPSSAWQIVKRMARELGLKGWSVRTCSDTIWPRTCCAQAHHWRACRRCSGTLTRHDAQGLCASQR